MAQVVKPTEGKYTDTLNLPRTDFPIRPNAKQDDPAMIIRWEQEQLFRKSFELNKGKEKFILHDGPPYANGHLHLGHAYNNVLKDIVGKSQRMMGKQVPITPGWDCHGLPIELKVTKEHPGLAPQDLKKACRAYATKWIEVQIEERKRLGVLMDWDRPYATMYPNYEAATLRAFGSFVEQGYIERKMKTVPWCYSDQTVLASAEIEYEDRKDPSIYVLFSIDAASIQTLFPSIDKPVNLLIWTTTPWTLPLNRAVILKPNTRYVILDVNGTYVVTAKQLAASVAGLVGAEPKIIHEFTSEELVEIGAYAMHPFIEGQNTPIILDQSVLVDEGTAAVHNAPGCGPEDYEVGVKNNLEIFSPISPDGKYTVGIKPTELEGMPVVDGQIWVIKKLVEVNRLYFKTNIKHSYPHCWRCHSPLIFRATKQWFCDLSKGNLRDKVLQAIDTIVTLPEKSINRLKATVEGRLEWCLSRQRVWGTPIPAIICTNCDYTYLTHQHIEKVAAEVEKHGIEYWDTADLSTLLPADFSCPVCKEKKFVKEHDILDVWFDSGISHYAVLAHNPDLRFPADVYLEGKDQHRGWFQSSLLTAMVLEKAAPMKMIITHGFTVDDKGRKMSKSLGNGVEPQEIIDQLGTDGLRLWASCIDCADDAVVSKVLLQNVAEVFRKIRNTCRFLVSNLYDYDHDADALPIEKLLPLDRYALQRLRSLNENILRAYSDMNFTAIFHYLADYCSVELSSFYLDIIKDRLYTEKADGHARRSAQTTCWIILDTLTKLCAPVLSFTAEQISDQYQKNKKESIHLQPFASLKELKHRESHAEQWQQMLMIRSSLLKAIELARAANVVSHSREARLTIWFDDSLRTAIAGIFDELKSVDQSVAEFFKEFMIVSAVEIASSNAGLEKTELVGLYARVEKSLGVKCPRCWQYTESKRPDGLCDRCAAIIGE